VSLYLRPHRATTAQLQLLYPFVSEAGLRTDAVVVGKDLMGGTFCYDPWQLYANGELTNPNMVVAGQLGRGKSGFVKSFLWRQLAFGRRAWVIDPKGEYGPLATAAGVSPLRLRPGGSLRLNPLDLPKAVAGDRAEANRRRAELVGSLASSGLGRPLLPSERAALDLAVAAAGREAANPVLPQVLRALLEPSATDAASLHSSASALAEDGRQVALELRRLVAGDLVGMFDAPTTPGLDLTAPVVVVDLSALHSSPALPLLVTCATAWLQALLSYERQQKRLVVVDEGWAILRDLSVARWMQSAFKLSRAYGVANVVVLHRLSDLTDAGEDGSAEKKLAEGLLADTETKVVFAQPPSEAELTARLLGLGNVQRALLSRLPKGVALWRVGERTFLVEHCLSAIEAALVDTDGPMREA